MTLRPEAHRWCTVAVISNGLVQDLPSSLMQDPSETSARIREWLRNSMRSASAYSGAVAQPLADVEVIARRRHSARAGRADRAVLELNTLGDFESRRAYRDVLVTYLRQFWISCRRTAVCGSSAIPCACSISKDEGERCIIAEAPLYSDHLTKAAREFFAEVTSGLDALGIDYILNPRLVRGLDYYGHTAFEFTAEELGAQKTIMAGGRYAASLPRWADRRRPV